MIYLEGLLVALSMAIDASSVNAANAMCNPNIKKRKLLFCALLFGLFQFLMPLIGYFIGFSFKEYVEPYIPWIAFILLTLLAIKSLIDGIKEIKNKEKKECKRLTLGTILVEAIATSIDAFCIGFVFLDQEILVALIIFIMIGLITILLSFLSGIFGKLIGNKLEKYAPFLSSLIFLAIGLKILIEGLI